MGALTDTETAREEMAATRDRAIAALCERVVNFLDEDALERHHVEQTIDGYITDAVRQLRHVRKVGGPDVTTRIVHTEGGIDALQEVREKLLGRRLDLTGFDQPAI